VGTPAIEIAGLGTTYADGTQALDGIDLQVGAGEFVALVGPSGCGKTTLLNVVAGLLAPTAGQVRVAGSAPRAGDGRVAYALARDSLLPWRRAIDNVALGLALHGVPRAERRRRALHALTLVGLRDWAAHYPAALSQGMRQRCALARTFCSDAPVMAMDEPFSALDAQTKLTLQDVLLQLWEGSGRSVLFVTHDLGEACALADRVVVLSARPARVLAEVRVALPRPRRVRSLQRDAHFHALYAQVWSHLERGIAPPDEAVHAH
jgi:NitT/TauT family transport system ATP-binding protein